MPRATAASIALKLAKPTPPAKPRGDRKGTRAGRPKDIAAARFGINTSSKAGAALVSPDKPITAAQLVFVKGWAAGETVTTAAARAGYQDSRYAYRMSVQPNILKLYHEEKRKYEEAAGMTRKKVMDMLLEAYQGAKMVNEPASMVSAAREIGKMCGYYEPTKIKIDVNHTGNVSFQRMSDAELLQLITQGPGQGAPTLQLENES